MIIALIGSVLAILDSAACHESTFSERIEPLAVVQTSLPLQTADPLRNDSLFHPAHARLLPASMSFMERTLWDENGMFRTIGFAGPLTPENRKSELDLRRTMLTAHQIGGFASLGCMVTACVYGQHMIDHPSVRTYRDMHQTFVTASLISYGATALLAAFSPPPMIRRDEVSTTTIHKTLAWIHFAGMVVTPILASFIHGGRQASFDRVARIHQISGYVTTAAMAGSMIIITF
jgi:hypothetical protein